MKTNRIRVGKVVGPHGVAGGMKILPLTDYPERFASMERIRLYGEDGNSLGEFTLTALRYLEGKRLLVAETAEVTRRDGAQALAGAYIEILPEERYPLGEDEIWVDDLIGITVVDNSDGSVLGCVSDVGSVGENDIYIVRDASGKEHYIPAVKEFIAEVNLEKREMRIRLMEGLWEQCM